jgi:hypothetical protein
VAQLQLGMASVLPSAQSLLDDIRTLLIDDGAALSCSPAAHLLKLPVILARKLLQAVLFESRGELSGVCAVSSRRQGHCCVFLVPSQKAAGVAASVDATPSAELQLYGVCRSPSVDAEVGFTREHAMTAEGIFERQGLAEVRHASACAPQLHAFASVSCPVFFIAFYCILLFSRFDHVLGVFAGWHSVRAARSNAVSHCSGACRRERARTQSVCILHLASNFFCCRTVPPQSTAMHL